MLPSVERTKGCDDVANWSDSSVPSLLRANDMFDRLTATATIAPSQSCDGRGCRPRACAALMLPSGAWKFVMRRFWSLIALSAFATVSAGARAGDPERVTFTEHVAPIVFNNCTSCHRPGEGTPFSLMDYRDVRKRGQLIRSVVD